MKILTDVRSAYRVMIVDRDSMSSDLLAAALVRDRTFEARAVASVDLLTVLVSHSADLVVIGAELKFSSGNGFDLARVVRLAHPDVAIVMLLNQPTTESVVNAFRCGSKGVFSREQSMADFLDCIEHVRKGFIWAGAAETNTLLEAFKNIPSPQVVVGQQTMALTARQLQVVQHAAKGMTNKNIANELSISEHTVKNYLFRAFEKLGVTSRVELLFYLTIQGHVFNPAKANPAQVELSVTEV